jgi:ankyrin repeat protein
MRPSAAGLNARRVTFVRWHYLNYFTCMLVLMPVWLQCGAQVKPDPQAGPLYASIEQLQGSAKWRVFAAVVTHDHERLQALLSGGDSPNYFSARFRLPITMACQLGDLEAVQILVRGGANVNLFDRQDQNALMAATMNIVVNRPEIMRYLLANGADPNLRSPLSGESAFFDALRISERELLSILIEGKADVNRPDRGGESPLLFVTLRGNASLADFLKSRGARLISPQEEILLAASQGDIKTLQRILQVQGPFHAEADAFRQRKWRASVVNQVFADGLTPLMAAASNGDTATVKLILANGSNINTADAAGNTALMDAIENGHSSTIFSLLNAGADATTVNRGGVSTLLQASTYHDDPQVVQYLLDHGVSANGGSEINETPLMAAACYGHIETVKILLQFHVPLNAQSNEGLTALSEAAICGSVGAVKLLLDAGADPAMKDGDGKIALDYATKQRRADIVNLLKGQIPETQTPAPDPTN